MNSRPPNPDLENCERLTPAHAVKKVRLTELLSGSLDPKMEHRGSPTPPGDLLTLTLPASLKRTGREMRMLVENARITSRLIQNPTLSVHDIAKEE